MMGPEKSGYVWSHYPFTGDEWKARANMVAHHGQYPLPVIRLKAPEGPVVVIESRNASRSSRRQAPPRGDGE